MCIRNNNLPDGCNRMDTSYAELDGYDVYSSHEEYVLDNCFFETITKENFTRIMADEIKDVELKEGEIKFFIKYFREHPKINKKRYVKHYTVVNKNKNEVEMQIMQRSFKASGYKETVGFTVDGALSGKEQMVFTIEDNKLLQKIKAHKDAQLGEEINWWEIYSTQEEIDSAIARVKRACRTKIVKIEMNIVIN